MYLSKVFLDWEVSRNPYDWHRALWRLFPDRDGEARDFLYRVEQMQVGQGVWILMLSAMKPQRESKGVRLIAEAKSVDWLDLPDGIALRFKLTANPTKKIRDREHPERALRVPLIREDEQIAWLERKLEGAASLESVIVTSNSPVFFRKGGSAGKVATVTFQGVLQIISSEAVARLMEGGLGSAKSFGCGLLSLARV